MIIMSQAKLKNPYLSKSKYNDINYIGKIYGNFKIIDFIKDEDGRFAFKCMCLCQEGKEKPKYHIIPPSKLVNGKRISCGCKSNNVIYNNNKYIGQTFGALTVLEIIQGVGKGEGVLFRCHCKHCDSSDVIAPARHIVYGRQLTCGNSLCQKKEDIYNTKYRDSSYIGQQFGYLKVLSIVPPNNRDRGVQWICECQRDGNIITVTASAVARGNNISCGCLSSTAQAYISEILKQYGVPFKAEYSFADLKGDKNCRLRYDFGVLDKKGNLLCLIEYDGGQHRSAKNMYGSTKKQKEENYKRQKEHDRLKTEYAKNHNIPLYRFYVRNVANNKNKVEQYLKDIGVI